MFGRAAITLGIGPHSSFFILSWPSNISRSWVVVVQVEQPHVNVLSKVDLIEKYSKLPFNLDFFTDVLDLSFLLQHFSVSRFRFVCVFFEFHKAVFFQSQ